MPTLGQRAYEMRAQSNGTATWAEICAAVGGSTASATSIGARHYAIMNSLPWPITRPARNNVGRQGYRAFTCDHCGAESWRQIGSLNRARRTGAGKVYCSKTCSAAARRTDTRSPEQRRADRKAWDAQHRAANRVEINQRKKAAYYRDHDKYKAYFAARRAARRADPETAEADRQYKREYQARPGWREHKRQYDRKYRCERELGPEWGAVKVALLELEEAVDARSTHYQRARAKGTVNKKKQRGKHHGKNNPTSR